MKLLPAAFWVALWTAVLSPVQAADAPRAAALDHFERKIRPVLIQHCYECHSEEASRAKKLRGGLRLDTRDALRAGGDSGPVVVPGDPKKSLLLSAMRHEDPAPKMPPKSKLPDAVLADFSKWIETGAVDPRDGGPLVSKRTIDIAAGKSYWAFGPLRAALPAVRNGAAARTPIDRFVLAQLEAKGLGFAPSLPREKLVRRLAFGLTGLPPTPEQMDEFVNDRSPDAVERLVDRLLASDHFGERWARHWFDTARFAESGGYEFDGDRAGAFHYRDFVLEAFNRDLPFDEFVRLQIAGDLLKPGDFKAAAATGYLVAGPYPGQTTAKTLEPIRYDHLDDMIATVGTSLLGLSLGCARCHEHKYDPIPQQDYYHLIACLSRTDSQRAKLDPRPEIYQKAKAEFDQAHAPLLAARARFEKDELPGRLKKWYDGAKGTPAAPWSILDAVSTTPPGALKKLDDGSLQAEGKRGGSAVTWTIVTHTFQREFKRFRLDALTDAAGKAREDFLLTDLTLTAGPLDPANQSKPAAVKLKPITASGAKPEHPLAAAVDADKATGWAALADNQSAGAVFEADAPLGFDGGTVLTFTLQFQKGGRIERPRLSLAATPAGLPDAAELQHRAELLALLMPKQGQWSGASANVARWLRRLEPSIEPVYRAVEDHAAEEPKPALQDVFIAQSGRGGDVHYLIRGETARKNGVAKPGFVQVLSQSPTPERWLAPTEKGKPAVDPRVALANWLTDPEAGAGRLLARVIVNRLWQHHLGAGIVRTPNDFGVQGEPPTHPELLDWLASELIRNGWQLKPIHKLIVTSAVYAQGGEAVSQAVAVDPDNKLWGRVPPRRLEAEVIRDSLLAVGGSLDRSMYGPGTLDENSPRRSIYLTVKRSRLIPLMQMFDAPEPIQGVGSRSTTTSTTQALMLMNSPLVRRQAERLAQRVRPKTPAELAPAIEQAYRLALGRLPTPVEQQRAVSFISRQAGTAPDAALADFCQVLLCSNEFLYVD